MTPREARLLGLGLGVGWFVLTAQILAARYAGRHFLDIVTKENR